MNGAPSSLVSPGLWGFVAFFVLAIALYLLMRNMNARMRRMSYRAEELRREAEAGTDREAAPGPPEAGPAEAGPAEAGPAEAGPAEAGPAEADGPTAGAPGDGSDSQSGDGPDDHPRSA